jgi:hypothetical protein
MVLLILVFMLVVSGQSKNSGNEPSSWVVEKQRGGSERTFADWCREKAHSRDCLSRLAITGTYWGVMLRSLSAAFFSFSGIMYC